MVSRFIFTYRNKNDVFKNPRQTRNYLGQVYKCILNLRKVLDLYLIKYISATAALYFKVLIILELQLLVWGFFVKIISIPDEELFSETYVGRTASYFV